MRLLNEMQGKGLHPDVATFTNALSACAQENQLNRALSLIERMYTVEVAPDVASYNVLLQACDRAGKHAEMLGLIESMPKLGVEPNMVNYNTALRLLGRAADVKAVRKLLILMGKRGLKPDLSSYRAAINGTCEAVVAGALPLDVPIGILEEMLNQDLVPDLAVRIALMTASAPDRKRQLWLEGVLGCQAAEVFRAQGRMEQSWRGRGGRGRGAPPGRGEGGARGRGGGGMRGRGESWFGRGSEGRMRGRGPGGRGGPGPLEGSVPAYAWRREAGPGRDDDLHAP
jgi:pentatricopeptide repeat protein